MQTTRKEKSVEFLTSIATLAAALLSICDCWARRKRSSRETKETEPTLERRKQPQTLDPLNIRSQRGDQPERSEE
jgi:hypothetical protein